MDGLISLNWVKGINWDDELEYLREQIVSAKISAFLSGKVPFLDVIAPYYQLSAFRGNRETVYTFMNVDMGKNKRNSKKKVRLTINCDANEFSYYKALERSELIGETKLEIGRKEIYKYVGGVKSSPLWYSLGISLYVGNEDASKVVYEMMNEKARKLFDKYYSMPARMDIWKGVVIIETQYLWSFLGIKEVELDTKKEYLFNGFKHPLKYNGVMETYIGRGRIKGLVK
jgi:hypothetical protein